MSVQIEADKTLGEVREDVQAALDGLYKIVINQCWDSNNFNRGFTLKMKEALDDLLKVRGLLE